MTCAVPSAASTCAGSGTIRSSRDCRMSTTPCTVSRSPVRKVVYGRAVARLERPGRVGDGHRRGFDEPDQVEVDQVHDVGDVGLRGTRQGAFVPPVAEERVTVHDEYQRPEPGLLERGGQHHRGVQRCALPAVQHLGRIADQVTGVGPAVRRGDVPDLPRLHRLEDRPDDLVDPRRPRIDSPASRDCRCSAAAAAPPRRAGR